MRKQLMKGNEAIVRSAILAGCRAFYGYPITPASEIAEAAALYVPQVGGVFLQAESEVAAMNMIYGAASAGMRAMTASSGPGISLMQEGISYMAGAELPCVIADITRGGPGLGNIAAEQGDYHQVVKGGGHGNYRTIVLAPHSVQEMADLTALAFELADRYRNPVFVLADGFIGQMMEPVEFSQTAVEPRTPDYAVTGTKETRGNLIGSLHLDIDEMEAHQGHLEAKYRMAEEREVLAEEMQTVCAQQPIVCEFLLHAQRELLKEWMVRVRYHGDNANAACLMRSGECVANGGASRGKLATGRKAQVQAWRSWRARDDAT